MLDRILCICILDAFTKWAIIVARRDGDAKPYSIEYRFTTSVSNVRLICITTTGSHWYTRALSITDS